MLIISIFRVCSAVVLSDYVFKGDSTLSVECAFDENTRRPSEDKSYEKKKKKKKKNKRRVYPIIVIYPPRHDNWRTPVSRNAGRSRWRRRRARTQPSPPVAHAATMAPNVRHRRHRPGGPTRPPATIAMTLAAAAVVLVLAAVACTAAVTNSGAAHYTNQFAVRVAGAGDDRGQADRLAKKHGFVNRGQVSNYY